MDIFALFFQYLAIFNGAARNILVLDFWSTNANISVQCILKNGIAGLSSRHKYKFTINGKLFFPQLPYSTPNGNV